MTDATHRIAFLTNHALVVLALARWPQLTVRELAERVGITERATYAVLRDLESAGYLSRRRNGKRAITLHLDQPLPHPLLERQSLHVLVALVRSGTAHSG